MIKTVNLNEVLLAKFKQIQKKYKYRDIQDYLERKIEEDYKQ